MLERIKEVNKRPPPEESVALRIAVLIAVMAASLAVLQQEVGGSPLLLVVMLGIPGGFAFSHATRYHDGFWLKVGLAIALLVVFVQFLGSLRGLQAGALSDVQIPLAELFLWVQFLHSLDVPARRDLLFSLVSSLVLIAVGGVLSISLSYGLFLIVWAVSSLCSLVLAHRSELEQLPRLGLAPSVRRPLVRARGTAVRVTTVFAGVLALGAGAFVLLPAAGSARAVTFPAELPRILPTGADPGRLSNPTLGADDPAFDEDVDEPRGERASFGYFGFSDTLDTGLRGRPDDTVVMRVRASAPDFWKGQTFDRWDGRTWSISDDRTVPVRSASNPIEVRLFRPETATTELVQTFHLDRLQPNIVFAAASASELYFADRTVFMMRDGTIRSAVALTDDAVYTVVSERPAISADLLRRLPPDAPARSDGDRPEYLELPEMPARIGELASSITASAATRYDQVQALIGWMSANVEYTLDIPPLPRGADAVDHFLFEERRGFCEQIGTSLVVMLRSLGVPARLAVGYTPGERNPFTGLFEVRASDAHAWAEVYFPGAGWVPFDPTAAVPLAGEGGARRASFGLGAFLGRRLPPLPASLPVVIGGVTVAVVGFVVGLQLRARAHERRALAASAWSVRWQHALDAAGARCGRPRRGSESVREYVDVLRSGLLPHEGWIDALHTVEEEAYAGADSAPPERRAAADALLAEVGAAARRR